TDVESDILPPGLDENTVRAIVARKGEPEFMLEWRLAAFRKWLTMTEPNWQKAKYEPVDYQAISYYAAPKQKEQHESMDEGDHEREVKKPFDKLGIPLTEQMRVAGVAVDAVFDSVSVATTFKDKLKSMGVIFCSFSEAVREHPELVKKYLGSVVPVADNFFAA